MQQEPQGPDGHAAEEGAALRHGARSVLRSCRRFYIFIQSPPRPREIDPKHFRDHWDNLRKPLKLRKEWKFYSLKDTGITAMLKAKMPAIDVRDQARHSSLAITEIYTDHTEDVNPEIFKLDGAL